MDRWPYPFQAGMTLWDHVVFDTVSIITAILVINFKRVILYYIGQSPKVTKTKVPDLKKQKLK